MFEIPEREYQNHAFLRSLTASSFLHLSVPALLLWANILGFDGVKSHQYNQTQSGQGQSQGKQTKIEVVTRQEFNDGTDINTNVKLALESISLPREEKLYVPRTLARTIQGSYPPNAQAKPAQYAQPRQHLPNSSAVEYRTASSLEDKVRKNKLSEVANPEADLKKAFDDLPRDLHSISENLGTVSETIDKMVNLSVDYTAFKDYFRSGEGNLGEMYIGKFKPGSRDQKSFNDFFLAFANAYLIQNENRGITNPIKGNNGNIKETMFLTVRFNEDGSFQFLSIQMNPQFKDETGNYESHLRGLLDSIPKKFISPSMCDCRLPLPYNATYYVINQVITSPK